MTRKALAAICGLTAWAAAVTCTNATDAGCASLSAAVPSYSTWPTDIDTGSPFVPPVEITVRNYASLQTLTCFNDSVSLAINQNPAGGTLRGTTTVQAREGVATFPDLTIDKAGQYYTLAASAPALGGSPVESNLFTVIACAHDCWLRRADMSTSRSDLGVGAVNGMLYVVGGYDGPFLYGAVEAYDPATGRWTSRASMPTPRSEFGLGVVNGVLYAVGGYDAANEYRGSHRVEAYDPGSDRWTTKAPMPTGRVGLGVGVVNGTLYAVGGMTLDDSGTQVPLPTMEAYDPGTDQWVTRASMPTARAYLGVGVVGGVLYAVGGQHDSVVEAYDPSADRWTARAPLTPAGFGVAVATFGGGLYAVPGVTSQFAEDYVVRYDPAANTWTPLSPYSFLWARCCSGVAVLGSDIYVVGGYTFREGRFLPDNVLYRP